MDDVQGIQDAPVFSYTLASGDLRYIEIGEREIYLRQVPTQGKIFRGEISGMGPEYYINLSEILLEYAMSCEGCSRAELATEMLTHFGDQLGQIYLDKIYEKSIDQVTGENLSAAIACLLDSMDAKYTENSQPGTLEYVLDCCPLSECAKDTGLNRSVEMAYLSLVSLFNRVINGISPGWVLVQPSAVEINIPLHHILIKQ
jgi:hypothetical protein